MTLGAMKDAVLVYLQYSEVSLQLDGPTVIRLLNEALQYVYQFVVANDPGFYLKSAAFVTSTTVAHPADYSKTVVVEVPGATVSGGARGVGHKEHTNVKTNVWLQPSANYPTVRVDPDGLKISPSSTGTHWYIWQFGDITDETRDLSLLGTATPALIPWIFEEMVVLYACYLAQARDAMAPGLPETEASKRANIALGTQRKLEELNTHVQLFKRDTQPLAPVPKNPQIIAQ